MKIINELIQIDFRKDKSNDRYTYILVYNQYVFFFNESNDKDSFLKVLEILKKDEHPISKNEYLLKSLEKENSAYGFLNSLTETSTDFIGAVFRNGELTLISSPEKINPITSIQFRKLVNLIKPKTIGYMNHSDDNYKNLNKRKILGNIPDVFYHGTSSEKVNSILKYGLDKKFFDGSNFKHIGIYHEDVVFLNALFDNAVFYAENASKQSGESSAFPVIIELQIPDKSLLIPDYDAEFSSSNKRYYLDLINFDTEERVETKKGGFRVSKETGKWGYKGRIPPKFIRWLWFFDTIAKKWKKMKPNTWLKLTSKYDLYDIRYILRADPDLY